MIDQLIFIHGFNSGGGSEKASFLREHLPEIEVLSPTLPYAPDAAIAMLQQMIEAAQGSGKSVALTGSSLGGFYAVALGQRNGLKTVLINPLVEQGLLRHEIGPQQNYYTGETYEWSEAHCAMLDAMAVDPAELSMPVLVLLDADDELLDAEFAATHFAPFADVHLFDDGNHRFAHMPEALPLFRLFLAE